MGLLDSCAPNVGLIKEMHLLVLHFKKLKKMKEKIGAISEKIIAWNFKIAYVSRKITQIILMFSKDWTLPHLKICFRWTRFNKKINFLLNCSCRKTPKNIDFAIFENLGFLKKIKIFSIRPWPKHLTAYFRN